MTAFSHIFKLIFTHNRIGIKFSYYVKKVYVPIFTVSIIAPILPYYLYNSIKQNFIGFIITGFICILCVILSVYLLGLESNERVVINSRIKSTKNKFKR